MLDEKTICVIGAGGLIGKELVKHLLTNNVKVIAVDINKSTLEQSDFGANVQKRNIDVTDEKAVEKFIEDLVHDFGGIDILVSNVGTAFQSPLIEIEMSDLRRSFETNFFSHFRLAKLIGQLLIEQGNKGQMLFNISKQAVNPGRNFGAYGLPKSTLMFLVKQLALELGSYGIRVNGINADRIRSGLLSEELIAERAKSRGLRSEQ